MVRCFELVIPRRLTKQILDVWRCVVGRGRFSPTDSVLTVKVIAGEKLQPSHTVWVDTNEMQAVCGHLNREYLDRAAVTTGEQRCLPAFFRQHVRRRHSQHS